MKIREAVAGILREPPVPVIVECGGHVGNDTEFLLACRPTASMFVFEPDPRNLSVFRERGLAAKVKLIEAAVCEHDGTATLFQSSGRPLESTTADITRDWSYSSSIKAPRGHLEIHPWCEFPHQILVTTRALDSFAKEHSLATIDLLWADIQGAERELILGGQRTLKRTRFAVLEYSDLELYENQPCLSDLLQLLPGNWSILVKDDPFVLVRNDSFQPFRHPIIIIGAQSAWDFWDRRRRCRDSWMQDARAYVDMDTVFLLGAGALVTAPRRLDDVLLLPCPDGNADLPQWARWFCRWALTVGDWDYLFKCNDDTYVSVSRLHAAIPEFGDYVGAERHPGTGYASGAAGYWLSRRAARIVAEQLSEDSCEEDLLVGRTLQAAGVEFKKDERLIACGNQIRRPRRDNDLISTHGVGTDIFQRSHSEVGRQWRFRIVMPTCNAYAEYLPKASTALLQRYWPGHPAIDVLCYEVLPPELVNATVIQMGAQNDLSWTMALAQYLQEYNDDDLVLLMLDDYGMCKPLKENMLNVVQRAMLLDPTIANVHLTWQPVYPKIDYREVLRLPSWDYSVNTQAALWRRSTLLEIAQAIAACDIDGFELAGSQWFNERQLAQYAHCQARIADPLRPSRFVDETDKNDWVLPYHNLMHRGRLDPRHEPFLAAHALLDSPR